MRVLERLRRRVPSGSAAAPPATADAPAPAAVPAPAVAVPAPPAKRLVEPPVPVVHERRWTHLDVATAGDHHGLVERIVRRDEDGATVSGIFTPDEVAAALERLDSVAAAWTPSPIGSVLGMPLGDIGPENRDRTRYYDDSDAARAAYLEIFGFDPHERLAQAMAPLTSARRLVAATEGDRAYNAGQLRKFEPGFGGLRAHAGNEFRDIQLEGAMSHLVGTTKVTDHLSYFVVLQRPEIGGSLSVFDLLWEYEYLDDAQFTGDRDDSYFDDVPFLKVDVEPGDLVLFTGGRRWHRIEPVEGSRPRVTYGGFCAPSTDGVDLHFWT